MHTALTSPTPDTGEGHLGSVSVKEYQGFILMQKLLALETSEPLYFLLYETLVLKSGSQEQETVPCSCEIQYHCVEFSISPNGISP